MKAFDTKFGADFLGGLPQAPGVYFVYDGEGRLIYVGKAKNLRRRLGQYRNAQRLKKHAKMRSIIRDADRIEIRICESDFAACLLENELIRHMVEHLGPIARPEEVRIVESLPKTRSGKIMRRVLKARLQGLPEGDLSTLEE